MSFLAYCAIILPAAFLLAAAFLFFTKTPSEFSEKNVNRQYRVRVCPKCGHEFYQLEDLP